MASAVNDVLRATYFQRLFGQRILTVFHLRTVTAAAGGTSDATELQEVANRLAATASFPLSGWRTLVSDSLSFDEVRVQRLSAPRTVYFKSAILTAGTLTDQPNTANLAVSIEKRTLRAGRRGIGRIQMAGAPMNRFSTGEVDPTYLATVQTAWNPLANLLSVPLTGAVYAFCLYGGVPVTSDDDVMDVQAKTAARTMHRRTLRVGE